jgi:tetratricopeptide (TPR) repeat protein/tRNA A-37 threonylcarbamoyl transferase component Bud32
MTPERWKRITEIYSDLCDLPPEQQEQRLAELCAGDTDLLEQVKRILRDDPSEGKGFVDNPPLGDALARFTTTGRRLETGEVLAERFAIVRHLGSGGMGEVYEAEDRHLHTHVAIKLIRRDIADQAEAVARFRREITLARQVTHRSVCRIYDFFPASPTSRGDRVDFLTMELLSGETLAELMEREAPMPLPRAIPILEQLTSALDAAHAAGVLHRDLKGANVFLSREAGDLRVVITDFGLARSADSGDSHVTGSAWGAGTPLYMSPEQLEGGELGPQSDIYSLGVIMYQMATGVAPLQGHSPLQIAVRRIKEQPRSPRTSNPNIDPAWESAILRCLALDPKQRYAKGADVFTALGKRRSRVYRIPRKAVLVAAAALALSVAGWWSVTRFQSAPVRPDVARWYREGEVALADGSIAKAAKLFERSLEMDPGYLSARCRLAETYIELDMRDRAQEQILQAVGGSHRSAEERLLCEGVKATLTGQWDQALAAAKDRGNAQLDEARWNERAGRNAQAAALYEGLIKADSSQPGPLLRLANIRIREGKNAEATALLDRAEANYRALGNAEGLGEVALARAAATSPVPEAIRLTEEAIRRAREAGSDWLLVRAKLRLGARMEEQGKATEFRALTEEAIAIAERAGLAGQAASGFVDLGLTSFTQGKYGEAEQEFQRALRMASRYKARRAEARAHMALAQSTMARNQMDQANAHIDDALAYYRSTGDGVRIAQALRYQGSVLEMRGRFEEARAVFLNAATASPAPDDQLAARQRLAFLARQQTRYEEAVARFEEVVAGYEQAGNRVSAQVFRVEKANALTLLGRFADASRELDQVLSNTPVSERIQYQVGIARASLDFQQLNFDPALSRLEAMRAAAVKAGNKDADRNLRYELCPKYAEAARPAQAAPLCEAVMKDYAGRDAQLVIAHYAMAEVHMDRRQPAKAVAEARLAVALSEKMHDLRNTWYSRLILTQALHLAGNPEWKQARDQVRRDFDEVARQAGPSATQTYLSRPTIARRKRAVEQLQ